MKNWKHISETSYTQLRTTVKWSTTSQNIINLYEADIKQ